MGWGDGPSFAAKVKEDAPESSHDHDAPPMMSAEDGTRNRVVVLDSNAIFKGYGRRPCGVGWVAASTLSPCGDGPDVRRLALLKRQMQDRRCGGGQRLARAAVLPYRPDRALACLVSRRTARASL